MKSDELRTLFLKFFEEKGHTIIPSSSLIPKGDPTLLLTTAGMVQIKPYFLGEQEPPNRRLTSCQKCFRTTDIEEVGDATHLTFFEMLGNFSVGDYFKKEAITWAWEFVTERLKLDPERIWITVFRDDDEAFRLWQEIGIPEKKIVRFGEKDNFWGPAGSSGPCGPCSELHYDFRPGQPCGPDCGPNCECGRFMEFWNLVFTEFNQDEAGRRTKLPRPNIDTGMELERLVIMMSGRSSIYETDVFAELLETVSRLTGRKYGENADDDYAIRVVAEHGRSITFLIADGVLPGNEGRGYVLRRVLRRAVLFGRRLGLEKPFLSELAATTVKKMGHVYPELIQRRDFIYKIILGEEERFAETLATGLQIIESVMQKPEIQQSGRISGEDAFRLYDTYGFPVEITREIVGRAGLTVDMEGFEREMEKQRERARAAHKFDNTAGSGIKLGVPDTVFTGYHCTEQEATVIRLQVNGQIVDSVEAGQEVSIILDASPFYGEMGGQVGDAGIISGTSGKVIVHDAVRLPPDIIVHKGTVIEGTLKTGDSVTAVVDVERRLDIARNHTATHLLHAALRRVLGEHIQQRGSLVAPDRLRFDFSHLAAVKLEELKEVEHIVNRWIRENYTVRDEQQNYREAVAAGVTALFDEKYGDVVRVLSIGQPRVSAELCGGTHVKATGEIGYFHIISESSVGAGLRRIEAVTGRGAEEFINKRLDELEGLAKLLETNVDELREKVTDILTELDTERRKLAAIEKEQAKQEAEVILRQAVEVNGFKVLAVRTRTGNPQLLRDMADILREKIGSGIIVLGGVDNGRPVFVAAVTPDMVAKGFNAGSIIKEVSRHTGGGGGGKPNFAQAGGRDPEKLDEALALVKELVGRGG